MTYSEAIRRADAMRPNEMPQAEKVACLDALESELRELMGLEEDAGGGPTLSESGTITADADLLLPYPRDDLYVSYLMVMIDQYHQEWNLATNDTAIFRVQLADTRGWWRRGHRGASTGKWKI